MTALIFIVSGIEPGRQQDLYVNSGKKYYGGLMIKLPIAD